MKIEQSSLQSEGQALAWQSTRQTRETSLSIRFPDPQPRQQESITRADISAEGMAAQQSAAVADAAESTSSDPRMQLLLAIIEALTGRKVELFDGSALHSSAETPQPVQEATQAASNQPVWSLRIETSSVREELEFASYSARGQVSTSDGRQIDFALDLQMLRYEREESHSLIEAGNAPKAKDPLVLNLDTDQVRLVAGEFSFDLNADGKAESMARLGSGSAFLAMDRNGNGRIDNGSELFGPTSGDGFAELAALDEDGNGWIDENDAAFARLQVWRPDEPAQSLKAANVGALALDHVGTAFSLKTEGSVAGAVRSSGLFLTEDGQARSLQQIDLVV